MFNSTIKNETTLDVDYIRSQFPIFSQNQNGHRPLVFFDSAASAQKPDVVIQRMADFYKYEYANIHRGLYQLSVEATEKYEMARAYIADFFGVGSDPSQIIFTKGATESLNLLAHSLGESFIEPGDEIVITEYEHHANLVPWQQLAIRKNARLVFLPLTQLPSVAEITEEWLSQYITPKTKIVSFTGMSNALGSLLPVSLLGEVAHSVGALAVLDAAQWAAHTEIDLSSLPVDFAAMAGHKLVGPNGIGLLYARRELLEEMQPYQMGGDMIREVYKDFTTWNDIPQKFEAGTPPIAQAVGMEQALRFLSSIGMHNIAHHERQLTTYAMEQLRQLPGLHIYGEKDLAFRGGVISFNVENVHPFDLGSLLAEDNIAMRVGHHCCQVLMRELKTEATNRISFYLYNKQEEIDLFIQSMHKVLKMLR